MRKLILSLAMAAVVIPVAMLLAACSNDGSQIVGTWEGMGHSQDVTETWTFRSNGNGTVTTTDIDVNPHFVGWFPTEYTVEFSWRWVTHRVAGLVVDEELVLTIRETGGTITETNQVSVHGGVLTFGERVLFRV